MGSSIYTRTGDAGTTSLVDGSRLDKDSARVEAYGTVDEANSWVGAARAFIGDEVLSSYLELVQHRLYNCSSNLAVSPGSGLEPAGISEDDVAFLERAVDRFEDRSGEIRGFVLPGGGCRPAALLHVARTVCRRAERRAWSLARTEEVDPLVVRFLNRCSDFLFAAARCAAAVEGEGDVHWDKELPLPG